MSMGAIVSIHEVVADRIVEKVLGKKAVEDVIAKVEAFSGKYKCNNDDFLEKVYEDDPSELSYYCDIPDGAEDAFQSDYGELAKALTEATDNFREKTGLKGLYLVYNHPDDAYDDIDGFAWALPHSAVYQKTPEYLKFKKSYDTDTEWAQVVKFG